MNIFYDPKADAIDVVFREGKVHETRQIGREMYLDVDKNGEPLSLEILDASSRLPVNDASRLSFTIANYPTNFGKLKGV